MSQYHFDPDTYEALMAEEVPLYDRLQQEVAAAAERECVRSILDLGTGTGVTARHVLDVHPYARLVGIDKSPAMLQAARHRLPNETDLRLMCLEDPLPAESFDLVVSTLAVHHLDGEGKADLFCRVAGVLAPGGRFVLGDVVVPDDPNDIVTPLDKGYDLPSTVNEQLAWLRAAGLTAGIAWLERDLAVLVADADSRC